MLIFDIWHPDFSDEEIKFLSYLQKSQMKVVCVHTQTHTHTHTHTHYLQKSQMKVVCVCVCVCVRKLCLLSEMLK